MEYVTIEEEGRATHIWLKMTRAQVRAAVRRALAAGRLPAMRHVTGRGRASSLLNVIRKAAVWTSGSGFYQVPADPDAEADKFMSWVDKCENLELLPPQRGQV